MIIVLAGVNGAGKSSVLGSHFLDAGFPYFNPDEQARHHREQFPDREPGEIDAITWQQGVELLRRAIADKRDLIHETTLGGRTITGILDDALDTGVEITLIYCGLESVELHIERVHARATRGGHDIPEQRIRQRWESSMRNACLLAPRCAEVLVYDNSTPIGEVGRPDPRCLMHAAGGECQAGVRFSDMPDWAKPLTVAMGCRPPGP